MSELLSLIQQIVPFYGPCSGWRISLAQESSIHIWHENHTLPPARQKLSCFQSFITNFFATLQFSTHLYHITGHQRCWIYSRQ